MNNISKNNYEIFFIDYYDGNLTAEQSAELFLFLESHPGLKAEFDNFSNLQLDIPEIQFPNRESLKRGEVSISNIDAILIADLEGDNSVEEKQMLETFLKLNPGYEKQVELFKSTVSVPDYSIIYPDKKSLKKPVPFFSAYKNEIRYGIAAMLLLAFIAGMVSVFNRTMEQKSIQVAEENPVKIQTPVDLQTDVIDSASSSTTERLNRNIQKKESIRSTPAPLTAERNNHPASQGDKKTQANQLVQDSVITAQVPVQLAEAVPANQLNSSNDTLKPAIKPVNNAQPANHLAGNSNEKYLTVWDAIRQSSEKSLKKFVARDEPVMAYADGTANDKPSLVDVVSKGIEKVTNEKVKLETDKQNGNYSFMAGKFKIERK